MKLPAQHRWWAGVLVLILAVAGGTLGDLRLEPRSYEMGRQSVAEAGEEAPQERSIEKGDWPLWTSTQKRTARENAEAHWVKHQDEFPEYRSAQEYIEGAHHFLRGPPAGTLFKFRPNGDRLLYHPKSNTFAVQAKSGASRTMFRPRNGQRYWNRQ